MPTQGNIPKCLGQKAPVANTATVLFTAPSGMSFLGTPYPAVCFVYTIYVSNLDFQSGEDLVSVWLVKAGDTQQNKNAILNNYPIKVGENVLKEQIVLETGDSLVVQSTQGKSSFQAFGEVDLLSYIDNLIRLLIATLKEDVITGTLGPSGKEQLMLLADGAYVTQTNTNTNNCSCP